MRKTCHRRYIKINNKIYEENHIRGKRTNAKLLIALRGAGTTVCSRVLRANSTVQKSARKIHCSVNEGTQNIHEFDKTTLKTSCRSFCPSATALFYNYSNLYFYFHCPQDTF